MWDLTNNISYGFAKSVEHEERLRCILRNHRLWHTKRQRNIFWLYCHFTAAVAVTVTFHFLLLLTDSLTWVGRRFTSVMGRSLLTVDRLLTIDSEELSSGWNFCEARAFQRTSKPNTSKAMTMWMLIWTPSQFLSLG